MQVFDESGNELKEKPNMPEWHKAISPNVLMEWQGHMFECLGVDPEHDPNVIIFRHKGPKTTTLTESPKIITPPEWAIDAKGNQDEENNR